MNKLSFDWWTVVVLVGTVQGILLAIILFTIRRRKRLANGILATLILLMVWHHLQHLSIHTGYYRIFPHIYGADYGSLFLFGPLFYFYTLILTTENFCFKKRHLLHLLPFVFATLYEPVLFQGTEEKIRTINVWLKVTRYDDWPEMRAKFLINDVIFFTEFLHVLIYTVLSVRTYRGFSRTLKESFSNIDRINLRWLRNLTIGYASVLFVSFLCQKILYLAIRYYYPSFDYIYILPMTILIYAIGFNSIKQPEIFTGDLSQRKRARKYETSSLATADSETYRDALLDHMKVKKPYLDSELRLQTLAEDLNIPPNHLSQVINEKLKLSFFDFVNKYRIEEAKRILDNSSSDSKTLLQIAFEVGFNNKVSFNKYFKKLLCITPSQYKNVRKTKQG